MTRSEWMANKFKNQNLGAYDWVPEVMTTIDPAPRYHNRAMEPTDGPKYYKKMRLSEGIETFKNGLM
jgi:hypothetical protein